MDISVIIPTYKPREYFWKCLESLDNQTLSKKKFEIIIILNGCCEPYNSQIFDFIHLHPDLPIIYHQTNEGGVSHARNVGLDMAKGEYIAFIDDDDYVSSCYLEELMSISNRDTIGLCYPYAFNDGKEHIQLKYRITNEYEKCAPYKKQKSVRPKKLFNGPCMKLIHRDIIGDRRFDVRFQNGEDSLFMFLISDRVKWADFTSRNAIYYRRYREDSATTRHHSIVSVLKNCWLRFMANSKIYFSDVTSRNLMRYIYTNLGLCHTLINRLTTGKI